uniref:Peroxidase n=4 Tax=Oryza sativa subsp. japonica TaxID=39947 RepID=Q8L4E6_ORYSJ|nr:putative peroxidase 1 precursor [Oryza sativa Japonica Group]BAD31113.1 putative peroxidase 1 precursor [Oryza sativa Japonica Group]CAH69338.1 TPA: class III peroxidase 96 precursor [Oryza sativa Japonica Group]
MMSRSLCRWTAVVVVVVAAMAAGEARAQLQYGFYNTSCPGVEEVVRSELKGIFSNDTTLRAGLLRLHFHDCFVRGCDASLMLNSHNATAEKDADPNLTVRGYEAIEAVKAKVEATCPLVVSCADIMAMAARDAVYFSDGPEYEVETGRRDGNVSNMAEALTNLPPSDGNVTVMTQYFAVKNLTMKDMVVLSAAHTIGVAHCTSFSKRLYNFTGAGDQDPSLDPAFAKQLAAVCKPGNVASVEPLDALTPVKFDNGYYKSLAAHQALLGSDAGLIDDSLTGAYVRLMTNDTNLDTFFADFAVSMINMGRVGVLTGTDGQIRPTCGIYVD